MFYIVSDPSYVFQPRPGQLREIPIGLSMMFNLTLGRNQVSDSSGDLQIKLVQRTKAYNVELLWLDWGLTSTFKTVVLKIKFCSKFSKINYAYASLEFHLIKSLKKNNKMFNRYPSVVIYHTSGGLTILKQPSKINDLTTDNVMHYYISF